MIIVINFTNFTEMPTISASIKHAEIFYLNQSKPRPLLSQNTHPSRSIKMRELGILMVNQDVTGQEQ